MSAPPCKLGSSAITEHLEAIETGRGDEGDLGAIRGWLGHVTDGSRCYLATEEQVVVSSILRAFPEEFTEHIGPRQLPASTTSADPKLIDLHDGEVVYDESFWRKRPDWTYATATDPDRQP